MFFQRAIVACAAIALAACSLNGSNATARPPSMGPDVAAFDERPTEATFQAVHADILGNQLTADAEINVLNRLLRPGVPPSLVNAVIADLDGVDFLGAIRWARETNAGARVNPTPDKPDVVRKTAFLCWLMLAMRPFEDKGGVDLSHMDLRGNAPFIGQNMNLQGANFTGTLLSGGMWRGSDLTDAIFPRAVAEQPLTCAGCTWGSARATLHYADGRWTMP